ncbi:VOC family protein [Aldersonia kunmingensis]|uniref:VOC family protein n=1 Tax=Aldersonia kunmingensis TaxID=408066 RepID=UPI000835C011|nr:VOC family protein [Aldersonia kunmingensis]
MKAADLFHLGIVPSDMVATREQLSELFGYEWGPEIGGQIDVTLPSGPAALDLRCAYSVTEPRLELVREIPGTMWTAGNGIHHAGYWSDDVAADATELERQGFVCEASRLGPDGQLFFTFHRSTWGLLIELVTRAAEPGIQRCWAAPADGDT